MGDRQVTNILLAIGGVLLLGSAAVTGAIQWIAIIVGVLLARPASRQVSSLSFL